MGIDRLTAYVVATRDDLHFTAAGPHKNGKWSGWITLPVEDQLRPLVSSEPIYDSREAAVQAMRDLWVEICKVVEKETEGKHPIDSLLGEAAGPVKEVIAMAKRSIGNEPARG